MALESIELGADLALLAAHPRAVRDGGLFPCSKVLTR